MTKGRNKNSYYNEYFLRGLPHLCKKAPRPGNVIMPSNSKYEPDLFLISEEHPIPEQIDRNDTRRASIEMIEQCIQENGPKGRIPLSLKMKECQVRQLFPGIANLAMMIFLLRERELSCQRKHAIRRR